jgi:molybdenum cofactor biosynthesis protein B
VKRAEAAGTAPRVATVTVSDSRVGATDTGGALLRALVLAAGFSHDSHAIVRDEVSEIRAALERAVARERVDAVILTGGTGIGPRDVTLEAVEPLLACRLDGFGEAFRRLSWDQVGARSILSRAAAGVMSGRLVFALPGSPKAVQLAMDRIIAPLLEHALAMLRGQGHRHSEPHRGEGSR